METAPFRHTLPLHEEEERAWRNGQYIVGIDEAGRGAAAGPVVAAAVILPPYAEHPLLRDSKRLTPSQRATAYTWICRQSTVGIGSLPPYIIDKKNILEATRHAMHRAFQHARAQIETIPQCSISDAVALKNTGIPNMCPNKGEDVSRCVAAASIVAKVYRDRLMQRAAHTHPLFAFNQHKGYLTQAHRTALATHNACPNHRLSYLKRIIATRA